MAFAFAMIAGGAAAEGQKDWTGFYVGGYAGASQSSDSMSVSMHGQEIGRIGEIDGEGGVFGALAGYNRQFGRAVVGLEVEAGLAEVNGAGRGAIMQFPVEASVDYIWTGAARVRAGVLASDSVLLYATGGVAAAYLDGEVADGFEQFSDAALRWGWVAGAGVEWAATERVRLRVEYLHADLGESKYRVDDATIATRSRIDSLRAALIYAW